MKYKLCRLIELERVLKAYAVEDPELGYCQGLNFIAFMLLIHLDEEVSFTFKILIIYNLKMN